MASAEISVAQLRAFLQVAEAGGFAASGHLIAGDPGVRSRNWQLVRRLEKSLSVRLDTTVLLVEERTGVLTDEGRALRVSASAVVDAADRFDGTVRDLRQASRVLVGCYPSHVPLVAAARDFLHKAHPEVLVQPQNVDDASRRDGGQGLLRDLVQGQCDVLIVQASTAAALAPHLTVMPLYEARVVAVVADRRRSRAHVELADFVSDVVLASPQSHASRALLDNAGVGLRVKVESESIDALVAMADASMGVALVPSDCLPLRERTDLPTVVVDGEPLTIPYVVATRRSTAEDSPAGWLTDALLRIAERGWGGSGTDGSGG